MNIRVPQPMLGTGECPENCPFWSGPLSNEECQLHVSRYEARYGSSMSRPTLSMLPGSGCPGPGLYKLVKSKEQR